MLELYKITKMSQIASCPIIFLGFMCEVSRKDVQNYEKSACNF